MLKLNIKIHLMRRDLKGNKGCYRVGIMVLLSFFHLGMMAQSYIGQSVDNYSGVHGVLLNPANVFNSPFASDINIASVSTFVGNDYIGISLVDALDSGSNFSQNSERTPLDKNHFFGNVDILGPSVMFNLGEKQSVAFTTRLRGFFNLNDIPGALYERIEDGFDIGNDFQFSADNLNLTAHYFSEIGLTYGREIVNTKEQFLKGGITLKYLAGYGAAYISSQELSGEFNGTLNMLNTQGTLSYGNTSNFESQDLNFANNQGGVGFDIGLVYEYRKRIMDDKVQGKRAQEYKFKLALSLTDIGSINYKNAENTVYDANGSVSAIDFQTKTIDQILEDNYSGTRVTESQKVLLPSALQILGDYYIGNKWYLGLHTTLSMRKASLNKSIANTVINTATLVPRWESKWLSVYSPVGLRQYGSPTWGLGFRLGPLTVGSGSILTNLLSDNSKSADFYMGLKIPLYKNVSYANKS